MTPSEIVALQPKAWSILARAFDSGRVASTYLFDGPEGIGKWPLALLFTALMNCSDRQLDESTKLLQPCGACRNCRAVFGINFEDMLFALPIPPLKKSDELTDKVNEALELKRTEPFALLTSTSTMTIPISLARDIKLRLSRKGSSESTRVALFYGMELMKAASADALLKMIEEPPANTVLILTTSNIDALLPTIVSRSQRVRLFRSPEPSLVNYLIKHYEVSDSKAKLLCRISEGSLGKAISLSVDDGNLSDSRRMNSFLLFKSLVNDSKPETVSLLLELISGRDRSEASDLLRLWQSFLRDCAWYATTGDESGVVNVDLVKDLAKLSVPFGEIKLVESWTELVKNALADMKLNVHIQAALAALTLRMKESMERAA